MAVKLIDLSQKNVAFARLQARVYERNYTPVPNSALPKTILASLDAIFTELTGGRQLSLADSTLLVKANEGVFARMFTPLFAVNEETGKFTIKWGTELLDLDVVDNKLVPVGNPTTKLVFKASKFNFSGRGDDVCVIAQLKVGADQVRMPLAVRPIDWNVPLDADEFEAAFEEDINSLLPMLAQTKAGATGSNANAGSSGTVLSFKDLEPAQSYSVTGYREVKTSYGINHILTLANGVECWGHSSVKNVLLAGPVITPEQPAILSIISRKELNDGKFKVVAAIQVTAFEETDEDDFLLLNF